MSDVDGTAANTSGTVVNRRALLRASGVAAGIAGIGGIAAASAPPAGAAAGDPVLIGATNDAGTSSTALRSTEDGLVLILKNQGRGAPLRLRQRISGGIPTTDSGDLMNVGGDLRFSHGDSMLASVFTADNASRLVPVRPYRFIDTRISDGGANLLASPDDFDSAGRLLGGREVQLQFSEVVYLANAVFMNLTVTQPAADGYLTVWPDGGRLATSALSYSAGQTVANFCVSDMGPTDTVMLYTLRTTHVLVDVLAFDVGDPRDVANRLQPTTGSSNLAGAARTPPAWHTSQNG
ncbi:hypothetical protein [Jatrophihabitans sp.]|jgi:hypothetical protein|uniref:hypothetical protein n=1 Tax=Jatrophihabitans sp. TaxID=1932789 RepID=UPI002F0BD769